MNRPFVFAVLIACLLTGGCGKRATKSETDFLPWKFSPPAAQGLNAQLLDSASVAANRAGFVHSLLIIRNGYLVAESYYQGFNESTPHNVMSVSKSFLSALIGIALREGYLDNLDQGVLDFYPEYVQPELDQRKHELTLRHLLSMRMGIAGEQENYFEIYHSANWIKTTIEYPLSFTPGTAFAYNTFATHLLSGIITRAGGMSTLAFAEKFLTGPLGITVDQWEQDPQGYYFGGNAMFFTPREMAVFGYLYLNHGRLNDKQVVPEEWVESTTSPSTDWGPNQWGAWTNYNYGYLWWMGQIGGYEIFMAFGHGGQFIIMVPEAEMIVVTTAGHQIDWDTAGTQELALLEIISRYVLPAIDN